MVTVGIPWKIWENSQSSILFPVGIYYSKSTMETPEQCKRPVQN